MKSLFTILYFLTVISIARGQQDAHFSQYVFNTIYINPAYAGYKQQLYLQHFYSAQWTGINGAPKSLSVAFDGSLKRNKVGLAVLMTHDIVGAQANTAGYVNYAYRLQVGQGESSRLAFGLGAGVVKSGIEGSKLAPLELGDVFIPQTSQSSISPDVRTGAFYSNEKFFVGISANNLLPQLLASRRSEVLLPIPKPHYYLSAGTIFSLAEEYKFKPTILLKDDHAGPTSLDLNGFLLIKERLWMGGLYRTGVKLYEKKSLQENLTKSSSMGIIMELFATEDVRFGYAFEYSTNRLKNENLGSHEVSLGITFGARSTEGPKCYF